MMSQFERIAIFGATGMTGRCTTDAAIKKGIKVQVLVRNPEKLPENLKNSVEIVQGNILNYSDVLKAVEGVEAVVVTLGTNNNLGPTTELSEGLKNIIQAMKETKIDTITVCLSAFLFDELSITPSISVPAIFKHITAEHMRMYNILKESGVKYVAVFPPHIADQPSTGYEFGLDKYLGRVVSKWDLGQFLVDALTISETHGHMVGIISK